MPPALLLLAVKPPAGLKLSRAGSRYASTNQLAAAFGFDPYGSQSGANGGSAAGLAHGHSGRGEAWWQKTLSLRNTSIALDDILDVSLCGGEGGDAMRVSAFRAFLQENVCTLTFYRVWWCCEWQQTWPGIRVQFVHKISCC